MDFVTRQPRFSIFRANRVEDDGRLTINHGRAMGRVFALGKIVKHNSLLD
ncbi:MAG: hypothetical protein IH991_07240 [Planctomycetes bacterium]|nr:hypothetical protein [Planctomycetota bacterium]